MGTKRLDGTDSGIAAVRRVGGGFLLCALVILIAAVRGVQAAPVPPPIPGLLPDAGDSYFLTGPVATSVEVVDYLEPDTVFGFYFAGDHTTLIPLFGSDDLTAGGPPSQTALVDFGGGAVYDGESGSGSPESTFTPTAAAIGFYLAVGPAILYSDPGLNFGGLDLFTAYQYDSDPLTWGFLFEGIEADGTLLPISFHTVSGLTALPGSEVPLPPALFLLVAPLAWLAAMGRRR